MTSRAKKLAIVTGGVISAVLLVSPTTGASAAGVDTPPKLPKAKQKSGTHFTKKYRVTMKKQDVDKWTTVTINGKKMRTNYGGGKFQAKLPPGEHTIKRTFKKSSFPKQLVWGDLRAKDRNKYCSQDGTSSWYASQMTGFVWGQSFDERTEQRWDDTDYMEIHKDADGYYVEGEYTYYYPSNKGEFERIPFTPTSPVIEHDEYGNGFLRYYTRATTDVPDWDTYVMYGEKDTYRFEGTTSCKIGGMLFTNTDGYERKVDSAYSEPGPSSSMTLTRTGTLKNWKQTRSITVVHKNGKYCTGSEARALRIGMTKAQVADICGSNGYQEAVAAGGIEMRNYDGTLVTFVGGRADTIVR